jgi:hypothetical protein
VVLNQELDVPISSRIGYNIAALRLFCVENVLFAIIKDDYERLNTRVTEVQLDTAGLCPAVNPPFQFFSCSLETGRKTLYAVSVGPCPWISAKPMTDLIF